MSDEMKSKLTFHPEKHGCAECAFFVADGPKRIPGSGYCFRHPPVVSADDQSRPVVMPLDYCGDGMLMEHLS